jgi:thiamine biosynthesis lipoprotein
MDSANRLARKMATLAELGFQRVDASPIPPVVEPVGEGRFKLTLARPSMGTLVSVTAIHSSRDLSQEAMGRAFLEMERVVDVLNRYDPASAVSYLNSEGVIRSPPPELSNVLGRALSYHRASRGVFDPTVQPLVDLIRSRTAGMTPLPSADALVEEIRGLMDLVDAGAVEFNEGSIRLPRSGMGVTLDGIAKGYVVDRIAEVLAEYGLTDYLVNAGGDIRSSGRREDGEAWQVAIQDPDKSTDFPDVIPLSGMAVATSGSYEIYYDPERTHHHIVSSLDGRSPQHSTSVSVVAPTALEADALATSAFVMDPGGAVAFIDSMPRCACLIVDRSGRRLRSARWRSPGASPGDGVSRVTGAGS